MPMTKPLPGSTLETAILINADCSEDAIDRETEHLTRIFGKDWEKQLQSLVRCGDRHLDCIVIQIGRRTDTIYFDISLCFPVERSEEQTPASVGR